jgi:alpha-tubulin suppressor-like RCC1 family protein
VPTASPQTTITVTPTVSSFPTAEPTVRGTPTPTASPGISPTAASIAGVTAISAGGRHTCALFGNGSVKCWGGNGEGELGDGTNQDSSVPVAVTGLGSPVQAIDAGGDHTCALTSAGGVECWGLNSSGQLGDGTTHDRSVPVAVSGLASGVTAITAGANHTCALTDTGAVECWGFNLRGQVGVATNADTSTPLVVSGLDRSVQAIVAGDYHTCALMTSGAVYCWGADEASELGDGKTDDRSTPVAVAGLAGGVTAISAGYQHTCALTGAGGVECWGFYFLSLSRNGASDESSTPVAIAGVDGGVVAISSGDYHTCAVTGAGGVECWGSNDYGQLGDGTSQSSSTAVAVAGLASGVTAVSGGDFEYTCALTNIGQVMCWGINDYGQLGDGTTESRLTPVAVSGL